jgi:ABC-type phosphate transport system auxiliary subunit
MSTGIWLDRLSKSNNNYREKNATLTQQVADYREALEELVRLKTLKEQREKAFINWRDKNGSISKLQELDDKILEDYAPNQSKAWQAALAVLDKHPQTTKG